MCKSLSYIPCSGLVGGIKDTSARKQKEDPLHAIAFETKLGVQLYNARVHANLYQLIKFLFR